MKSTLFSSANMSVISTDTYNRISVVAVPTISAYAVEWAEFTPPSHVDAGYRVLRSGADFNIAGELLTFGSPVFSLTGALGQATLLIHYHGIRDYEALFPQVTEPPLKQRLGRVRGTEWAAYVSTQARRRREIPGKDDREEFSEFLLPEDSEVGMGKAYPYGPCQNP